MKKYNNAVAPEHKIEEDKSDEEEHREDWYIDRSVEENGRDLANHKRKRRERACPPCCHDGCID